MTCSQPREAAHPRSRWRRRGAPCLREARQPLAGQLQHALDRPRRTVGDGLGEDSIRVSPGFSFGFEIMGTSNNVG